jgi:hypothetical protein
MKQSQIGSVTRGDGEDWGDSRRMCPARRQNLEPSQQPPSFLFALYLLRVSHAEVDKSGGNESPSQVADPGVAVYLTSKSGKE